MLKTLVLYGLIFLTTTGFGTATRINTVVKMTAEELKLYKLLMAYRVGHHLKEIPLSRSLTLVAQTHAMDLERNHPDVGACNMHSWSDKGKWSPCCYTPDHKQSNCMWSKPRELTSYTAAGYEIACGGSDSLNAPQALACWQGSPGHNDVILNHEPWKNMTWNAVGIGINGKYAVVWFGAEPDTDGAPDQP